MTKKRREKGEEEEEERKTKLKTRYMNVYASHLIKENQDKNNHIYIYEKTQKWVKKRERTKLSKKYVGHLNYEKIN